jgi:hypothetical protein
MVDLNNSKLFLPSTEIEVSKPDSFRVPDRLHDLNERLQRIDLPAIELCDEEISSRIRPVEHAGRCDK